MLAGPHDIKCLVEGSQFGVFAVKVKLGSGQRVVMVVRIKGLEKVSEKS